MTDQKRRNLKNDVADTLQAAAEWAKEKFQSGEIRSTETVVLDSIISVFGDLAIHFMGESEPKEAVAGTTAESEKCCMKFCEEKGDLELDDGHRVCYSCAANASDMAL